MPIIEVVHQRIPGDSLKTKGFQQMLMMKRLREEVMEEV